MPFRLESAVFTLMFNAASLFMALPSAINRNICGFRLRWAQLPILRPEGSVREVAHDSRGRMDIYFLHDPVSLGLGGLHAKFYDCRDLLLCDALGQLYDPPFSA